MIREEEIKAAVEASPLLGGCNLSVSGMNVKYCHKGQIVSDRQKNEEIIGLVMEGSMDVYSIALDGREILLSQLERGDCFGVVNASFWRSWRKTVNWHSGMPDSAIGKCSF